jgi:peptide deformylase
MINTLKILTIENPKEEDILRDISKNVKTEGIKTEEFQIFLDQLLQTAKLSEEQVCVQSAGISAPQVGRNLRVFYILDNKGKKFENISK